MKVPLILFIKFVVIEFNIVLMVDVLLARK